jgi:hypothetical protein
MSFETTDKEKLSVFQVTLWTSWMTFTRTFILRVNNVEAAKKRLNGHTKGNFDLSIIIRNWDLWLSGKLEVVEKSSRALKENHTKRYRNDEGKLQVLMISSNKILLEHPDIFTKRHLHPSHPSKCIRVHFRFHFKIEYNCYSIWKVKKESQKKISSNLILSWRSHLKALLSDTRHVFVLIIFQRKHEANWMINILFMY